MGKEGSPEPLDNSFYRRKLCPLMQRWLVFLFLGFALAPSSLVVVGSKHTSQENVSAVTEGPTQLPKPKGGLQQVPQSGDLKHLPGEGARPLASGPHRVGQWEGTTVGWGLPAPLEYQAAEAGSSPHFHPDCSLADSTPEGKNKSITVPGWGWGWLPCNGASGWGLPRLSCHRGYRWVQAKLWPGQHW